MKLRRPRWVPEDDAGMSTVEYAIGTLAAAAFAMVLMKVLTSDAVGARMSELVTQALSGSF
ncbi:DUF4244 domain-containing protein [Sporichthya polymorpha]|uniref:DUF4244 domain-containing protein n=1 Tax=Sporichthya polymorpha TaxID=35751 RepID=UPI00039F56E6|nr:DUF4244 domain-containing protein [Sporichthya polymorpha]